MNPALSMRSPPGHATLGDLEWHDLLKLLRPPLTDPAGLAHLRSTVRVRGVPRGASLFHQHARAGPVYLVRTGTFKTCRYSEDGYENVLSFGLRGDLLGLEGLCSGRQPNAARAIEDAQVFVVERSTLLALDRASADGGPTLRALSHQLGCAEDLAEILAAVSADARIARFLLKLSDRMAACGQSMRRLRLAMCRRDMASHLGLAHETVSRTLSALTARRCIEVHGRDIEILQRAELRAVALATRSTVDRGADDAARRTDACALPSRCEGAALPGRRVAAGADTPPTLADARAEHALT